MGYQSHFTLGVIASHFKGLYKENRAALLIWLINSIFLVRYLYKLKWISVRYSSISKVAYQIAEFLYVDDTGLITLNRGDELEKEVVDRVQILLDRWQIALNIPGRELKLEKCFWSIQDYNWKKGKGELKEEIDL